MAGLAPWPGRYDRVLIQQTLDSLLGVLLLLGWGLPFSIFGVKLLGRRCLFDSRAGELTIRQFARTRRRPLTDILAVQVVKAGRFGSNSSEGNESFVSYQINVMLDDPNEPRLFVAFHRDQPDLAEKAKQLADFLNVPLLMSARNASPRNKRRLDAAQAAFRSDAELDANERTDAGF